MRQVFMRLTCILVLALATLCWATPPGGAAPKPEAVAGAGHAAGAAGEAEHKMDPVKEELNLGTFITTILIFVCLFAILKQVAWKPIHSGLKNREEAIR